MKKHIFKIGLIAAFATAITFTSCQKMDEETKQAVVEEILSVNSVEEYNDLLAQVEKMTDEEFAQWEQQRGFTSFYTQAQKAYAGLDIDNVQTEEEVFEYVKNNAQFLQLTPDGEDYTLETTLSKYSTATQRVLNQDQTIQIGNDFIKVFKTGTAKTAIENKQDLVNMADEDFDVLTTNDKIEVTRNLLPRTRDILEKAHTSRIEDDEEKNRLYAGIEIKWRVPVGDLIEHTIEYTIRPYKKTLGVWFYCSRTIEASIYLEYSYTIFGDVYPTLDDFSNYHYEGTSLITEKIQSSYVLREFGELVDVHGFNWRKISFWATSGSIPNKKCVINEQYY
ncbi:MAG: hypothetical protein LBU91_00355 [Bacteroidales bacterium]|jgi:hypothetical protein|nr:hypothetical protein [Bacteroidales bacterium]